MATDPVVPGFLQFEPPQRRRFLENLEKALPLFKPQEYLLNRRNLAEFQRHFPEEYRDFFFPGSNQGPAARLSSLREAANSPEALAQFAGTPAGILLDFFSTLEKEKRETDNEIAFFLVTRACPPFLMAWLLRFLTRVEPLIAFSRVAPFLKHRDSRVVATLIAGFPDSTDPLLQNFLNHPFPRVFAEALKKIHPEMNPASMAIIATAAERGAHFKPTLQHLAEWYQEGSASRFARTQIHPIQSTSAFLPGGQEGDIFACLDKNFNREQYRELLEFLSLIKDLDEDKWAGYLTAHRQKFNNTFLLKLQNFHRRDLGGLDKKLRKILQILGGEIPRALVSCEGAAPIDPPRTPAVKESRATLKASDDIPFLPVWKVEFMGRSWDLMGILVVVVVNLGFFFLLLFVLNS